MGPAASPARRGAPMSELIRWEWAIMFGLAIGLGLWELRSVRRAMREPTKPRRGDPGGGGPG